MVFLNQTISLLPFSGLPLSPSHKSTHTFTYCPCKSNYIFIIFMYRCVQHCVEWKPAFIIHLSMIDLLVRNSDISGVCDNRGEIFFFSHFYFFPLMNGTASMILSIESIQFIFVDDDNNNNSEIILYISFVSSPVTIIIIKSLVFRFPLFT